MIPTAATLFIDAIASTFGKMQVDIINASIWTDTSKVVQAVKVINNAVGT